MSYRTYIGYVPKAEYERIKNFTIEELYKYKDTDTNEDYVEVYDICESQLYGFGKGCKFGDKKYYKPFFLNNELQDHMTRDNSDFWIIEKEFLRHIIDHYLIIIRDIYKDLLDGIDGKTKLSEIPELTISKLITNAQVMASEWEGRFFLPYDLDKGDSVVDSRCYEYGIFELVRIYKHFDWENNIVVYYGY